MIKSKKKATGETMDLSTLSPMDYYDSTAREQHRKNCEERFDALLASSGVNVEENRATAKKYREQLSKIDALNKQIKKYKIIRGFVIAFMVIGLVLMTLSGVAELPDVWRVLFPIIGLAVIIGGFLLIFLKLNKLIRHFDTLCDKEEATARDILALANSQIAPLIALFRERDTHDLIEKTVPELDFEDRLSTDTVRDLAENYDFTEGSEGRSSTRDTVSGRFFGNPFFFERSITETMGTETYHGTLVIHWTTRHRDSKGNTTTRHHSQTLHASVTKPKPFYSIGTALHYGNQAAPDLSFSRDPAHVEKLSEKQLADRIEDGEKELAERARDALSDGGNFTEMANTEFEVLFGALNRNNEQQFRLLFTPLAQTDTVKLLCSKSGYGDDFKFIKNRRHNIVASEHAQSWVMDTHVSNYVSYDVDICREKFISFNENYFKSVYFDFAPLLTIPAYQHAPVPSLSAVKSETNYTHKEYEALANDMGAAIFAHPDTATEAILKAEHIASFSDVDRIEITAYSYGAIPRTDFVPVFGGDGRMHNVPVHWVEYYPLVSASQLEVKSLSGITPEEFSEKRDELSQLTDPSNVAFHHGLLARLTSAGGAGIDEISKLILK